MNPIWVENPREWIEMDVVDKLKYIMKYTCTGPCGQSSHVHAQRVATVQTLTEAIDIINTYRDFVNKLDKAVPK